MLLTCIWSKHVKKQHFWGKTKQTFIHPKLNAEYQFLFYYFFFLYNIVMVYVSLFAYLMLILRGRQNLFLNKAAYHFIKNDF